MVEVHNLTKTYGTVQALRGVDFTLEPGKVYGLLGVNGAGKTTTLQLLAGYITPTAGEVLVDGISMEKSPVETKQKIENTFVLALRHATEDPTEESDGEGE